MPSGGAWQMLLGKPMLRAFAAVHEYVQDTVTLCTPEGTVTLTNESDAEGTRQNKVAIAHVSDPGECCGISPLKQRQVDGLDQHDTVDDALGLLQDTAQSPSEVSQGAEDGSRTPKVADAHASDPGACSARLPPRNRQAFVDPLPFPVHAQECAQTYSARKRARRQRSLVLKVERMQARVMMAAWSEMDRKSGRGSQTAAIAKVVFSAMGLRATTGGKSGTGGDGSRRDGGGGRS
ncbi:hypothetical protein C8J57DRAFT_1245978 [Mycena rebaudengoi]|nr:hypothetical protein C8J57DRAFT_1245978 [Mycena rebaudengoi]